MLNASFFMLPDGIDHKDLDSATSIGSIGARPSAASYAVSKISAVRWRSLPMPPEAS
jgi:hypothetical protein